MSDCDIDISSLFPIADGSLAVTIALPAWEKAMRACFRFEVAVRLIVQRNHPSESVTLDVGGKENGLLTLLFNEYAFTDTDQHLLRKCNTLRNKLIHCEPDAIQRLLTELDPDFNPPNNVQQIKAPDGATREQLLEIIATRRGAKDVQETFSKDHGFFGWMLQAASDGTFVLAAKHLANATCTLLVRGQEATMETDAASFNARFRAAGH